MKPRHVAAFALVGWYLMIPPKVVINGTNQLAVNAPISQWGRGRLYASERECDDARAQLRKIGERPKRHGPFMIVEPDGRKFVGTFDPLFDQMLVGVRCIATDDPRLKAN